MAAPSPSSAATPADGKTAEDTAAWRDLKSKTTWFDDGGSGYKIANDDGRYSLIDPDLLARCCVVLVRTEGPVNLGQICRSCGNLGIFDLRLVNPVCEVNTEDARKFANHSRNLLLSAPVYTSVAAATSDCSLVLGTSARRRLDERELLEGPEHIPSLLVRRPAKRFAIVFGNEKNGLNADELASCQAFVHVPTRGEYTSFNLAHAVSIVLYSVSRAGQAPLSYISSAAAAATTSVTDTKSSAHLQLQQHDANDDNNDDDDADESFDLGFLASSASSSAATPIPSTSSSSTSAANTTTTTTTTATPTTTINSNTNSGARGGKRARLKAARQGQPAEPASRAHIDALRRYFVGTADRFQLSDTDAQRAHFAKVCDQMFSSLQFTAAHANVMHGVLQHFNSYVFGDKANEMATTGRSPAVSVPIIPIAGQPRLPPLASSSSSSSSFDYSAARPIADQAADGDALTYREKASLKTDIFKLPATNLGAVVAIIQRGQPQLADESEEIEIDIDALSIATLRELQRYVAQTLYDLAHPPPMIGAPPADDRVRQDVGIPASSANALIGVDGVTITSIERESNTCISIADVALTNPSERIVSITGTPQDIETAIQFIRTAIVTNFNSVAAATSSPPVASSLSSPAAPAATVASSSSSSSSSSSIVE